MKLLNIDNEIRNAARKCLVAFNAKPDATLAWCCHHELELEQLTGSAANRIEFILTFKKKHEQVTRLNNFRPFLSPEPPVAERRREAYIGWIKAYKEWGSTSSQLNKAGSELRQASEKLIKAQKEWVTYCRESASLIAELHARDVPGHTWNGKSIF